MAGLYRDHLGATLKSNLAVAPTYSSGVDEIDHYNRLMLDDSYQVAER